MIDGLVAIAVDRQLLSQKVI